MVFDWERLSWIATAFGLLVTLLGMNRARIRREVELEVKLAEMRKDIEASAEAAADEKRVDGLMRDNQLDRLLDISRALREVGADVKQIGRDVATNTTAIARTSAQVEDLRGRLDRQHDRDSR